VACRRWDTMSLHYVASFVSSKLLITSTSSIFMAGLQAEAEYNFILRLYVIDQTQL
jgi:hypothetical protein